MMEIETLTNSAYSNIALIEDAFNIYDKTISNLIGDYRSCWIGHSANKEIRENAASGGIVTELLLHALKTDVVDKVLVSKTVGLGRKLILTNEAEAVLLSQGSIYSSDDKLYPVRIEDAECAVVALPCQAKVLRKNKSNPLIIGLFCGHRIQRSGIEFLLNYLGIDTKDILDIGFRVKSAMMGSGLMVSATNNFVFIPSKKYYGRFFNFFFIPPQCMKCTDQTAEYADISCGDAWLKGLPTSQEGISIFMARTERGEQLVRSAIKKGAIVAEPTFGEKVVESQKRPIYIKKGKDDVGTMIYRFLRGFGCFISDRPRLHFLLRLWLRLIGIKK